MATINIDLPDGNRAQIPEYMLSSQGERMINLIKALVSADDKASDNFVKLVNITKERNKEAEKTENKQEQYQKDALAILNEIDKNTEENSKKEKVETEELNGALAVAGSRLMNFAKLVGTGTTIAFGFLFKNAMNLGDALANLAQSGISTADGQTGATVAAISQLNSLGFTTAQAAGTLAGFGNVVQTVGKNQFVQFAQQLGSLTNFGAEFGMSMQEAVGVMAEDLAVRQKLGILNEFEAATAAKRSADLFRQQLAATTLLGKSIEEIRGASTNTLEENANMALRIQQIALMKGDKAAADFQKAIQEGFGNLSGRGLDQGILDAIGNEIGAFVPFAGEAGKELFRAFNVLGDLGDTGGALTASIEKMNQLSAEGDVAGVEKEMKRFEELLGKTAQNLTAEDMLEFNAQLQTLGPAGEALAKSVGSLRTTAGKMMKEANLPPLAKGAKAFENAMNQLQGGFASMFNNISGALGPSLMQLANAFNQEKIHRNEMGELMDANGNVLKAQADIVDENGKVLVKQGDALKDVTHLTEEQQKSLGRTPSIMNAFKDAMDVVRVTLNGLLGVTEDGATTLADTIRDRVVPIIKGFADWFADGGGKKILNFFSFMGGALVGFADGVIGTATFLFNAIRIAVSPITWTLGKLGDAFTFVKDKLGEWTGWWDKSEDTLESSVGSIASFGKAIGAVLGGLFVFKKALGAFGMIKNLIPGMGGGAASTAAQTAGGAAGGGLGSGIKNLGKGIGKGLSGILKGIASGFKALGDPKALLGVVTLAGIGAAMQYTIVPGFKAFTDINWETIGKAVVAIGALGVVAGVMGSFAVPVLIGAAAIGALGLALQLFPIDALEGLGTMMESALSGVATVIESVFGGIGTVVEKVSEAIVAVKTAGAEAEAVKMEGATNAIKELAGIDDTRFAAISTGIDTVAQSLVNFSGAVGDDGFFGMGGSGADVDKQMEQVGIFKAFAELDSVAIAASSTAIGQMVDVYTRFAQLDSEGILASADAITKINEATGAKQNIIDKAVGVFQAGIDVIAGGVSNMLGNGGTPATPDQTAMTPAQQDAQASGDSEYKDKTTQELLAIIAKNTHDSAKGLGKVDKTIRQA